MKRLRTVLPKTVKKRIAFGFATALLLIALGFTLTLYSYSQYRHDSKNIEHTHEVTNRLSRVLSLLTDMETGVRGYVATSNPVFLQSYEDASPELPKELDSLQSLVATNGEQRTNFDTLKAFVALKRQTTQLQINVIQKGLPVSVARDYMLSGKVRMDRVREQVALMTRIEQGLLIKRSKVADQSFRTTLIIIFSLSLLTFVALIVSFNLLENELNSRQETEDQLRAYEEELREKIRLLETSNEELERFAFVASHDMQEPLRKIQSFGNLLRERYEPQLGEEGRMFMSKVLQSAERMSKMIRDLLNFSRLSNKKEPFAQVSLAEVVQNILSDQELKIKAVGAQVHCGQLPVIEAIESQMDHLFLNLISNSLKFVDPDRTPIIKISSERIDGADSEELVSGKNYYRIAIEDNGIGFEEKYSDHIFKIFQRLHGKNTYEGTGIGLAICKRIVNYRKGLISVHSQPGSGTTFVVVLPEKQIQSVHEQQFETNSYSIGG